MLERKSATSFSAVSVEPAGDVCCDAARRIAGDRMLVVDAPPLPLDDFDRIMDCRCKYKKWSDVRQDERRSPIPNQFYFDNERRGRLPGRRALD